MRRQPGLQDIFLAIQLILAECLAQTFINNFGDSDIPGGGKLQKVILYSKDIVHEYDPFYGIAAHDIVANTDCKLLSIEFHEIENALIKTGIHCSGAMDYESTSGLLSDSFGDDRETEEVSS